MFALLSLELASEVGVAAAETQERNSRKQAQTQAQDSGVDAAESKRETRNGTVADEGKDEMAVAERIP
jgi:hypothetical protein